MSEKEIEQRIAAWLEDPFDLETKQEIRRLMAENPQALRDAFFQDLSFGTGGMRGLMGVGTNRLNIYTIRAATQGLSNYLKKRGPKNPSVFIGYDVRENSRSFAEETAKVLAGNQIKVFLAHDFCPTPLVSFACRQLQCSAAVMITASHNPPQYNGYKVYWKDGGQVVFPHDQGIMEEVKGVKEITLASLEAPHVEFVKEEIDAAYFQELKKLQLYPQNKPSDLKIIYTNLHGTGIRMVPKALQMWGFPLISLVGPQSFPDGKFSNAPSPNPEEKKALQMGAELLLAEKADLLIATDPDADRMGIVIRHNQQSLRFTGHQIASLCLYHICSSFKEKGALPPKAACIKTIVTTELFKKIANSFGVACIDVLTGFKYIAEKMHLWELSKEMQFLFGAEESYGYLFGTFVRDKDAVSMSCLVAEMALQAKKRGQTLQDLLYWIYQKYGIHREALKNLAFPNTEEGMKEIHHLMEQLRKHPPSQIEGQKVTLFEDYLAKNLPLPPSDVLRFWLADGSKLVIRPSGTEPKVKIYAEVVETKTDEMEKRIAACDQKLEKLLGFFRNSTRSDTKQDK
jgi:phosphomannomutase